ncbi:hypothetical protein [Paraferrimonas sedimenticola]|uniref:Lipocalin-like domain-containing protein n=1 Tax=Paraferrimonas sedimenticola TaxID=375674 RepID=A0AA37RVK6_9GAMM|nr:hypothetical protein [Paraferrimonas sedimenticola]GLP96064.1 hypothetical protein GCM10007895_13700 [Paraferrimonas sedimenticola]
MLDTFLGSWTLINDECTYEVGEPLTSAKLVNKLDDDELIITLTYVDSSGTERQFLFEQYADGIFRPDDTNGGDETSLSFNDDGNLEGVILKDGEVVSALEMEVKDNKLILFLGMKFTGNDLQSNTLVFEQSS